MSMHNGFTPSVEEGSYEFLQIALEQFDWWKELIGTKCQVVRSKKESRYHQALGASYSSNLPDEKEVVFGNYVILINLARIVKKWNETNEPVYFYDNKDYLKLGDVLIFSRGGRKYQYKITEIQTLGELGDTLNYYSISPYIVTQSDEMARGRFSDNENLD